MWRKNELVKSLVRLMAMAWGVGLVDGEGEGFTSYFGDKGEAGVKDELARSG